MAHRPTFVAKGAFASGISSISPALPAGIRNGDLLLLFVSTSNQALPATPTGWTVAPSSPQGTGVAGVAGGIRIEIFYKFVGGIETAPATGDSGDLQTAIIMAFRGVNPLNPFNTNTGSVDIVGTTAITYPGVTTTVDECLIVHGVGLDQDAAGTAQAGTPTNANLTGVTEHHDQTVSTATGGGLAVVSGAKVTAGATGNTTATGAASTTHAYITLALEPGLPLARAVGQYESDEETVIAVGGNTADGVTTPVFLQGEYSANQPLDNSPLSNYEIDPVATSFNGTATESRTMKQWRSDATSSRRGSAMQYDDVNKRYLWFGGYDGTTRYNDVWELYVDRPGMPWRKLAPTGTAPTGRNMAGSCIVKGNLTSGGALRMYLIIWGGATPTDSNTMHALRIDTPGSEAWTTITQTGAPAARGYITNSLVSTPVGGDSSSNYIYLFSGWGAARTNDMNRCTFDVDSPTAVTWTVRKANGTAGNPSARSGVIMDYNDSDGMIYIFGGYTGSSYLSDFWQFDDGGNVFTQVTVAGSAPAGREMGSGGYYNNRFWYAGGWAGTAGTTTKNDVGYINDLSGTPTYVEVRANDNAASTAGGDHSYPPHALSANMIDSDHGWLVERGMFTYDSTERYGFILDLNDGVTSDKPAYGINDAEFFTARDAATSVWNPDFNEWVVIAGFDDMSDDSTIATGTHSGDVWVYKPSDNTWRYANKGIKGLPHSEGRVAAYDTTRDRIILFGGLSGVDQVTNEVWALTRDGNGNYKATRLNPTGTPPSPRWLGVAVYDAGNDRFLTGLGRNVSTLYADMYSLSFAGSADGAWTTLSPTGTPPNASWQPAFWNKPSNNRMYLYGGSSNSGGTTMLTQFRYLDYSTTDGVWTIPSSSGGVARRGMGFGFDETNDRLIIWGGHDGTNPVQSLQYYDLATSTGWTTATPASSPDARRSLVGTFYNGKFYISGGRPNSGMWYNNTWELTPNYGTPNSSTWVNKFPRIYNPSYFKYASGSVGTSYHWQYWLDAGGHESTKSSFGGNAESSADFTIPSAGTNYDITKTADYDVAVTPAAITKTAQYLVAVTPADLTKSAVYTVATTPADITKTADYDVAVNTDITKSSQYAVPSDATTTKGAQYAVASSVDITKSSQYTVQTTPADITKTADYDVLASFDITKSAQYAVPNTPADISKSGNYAVAYNPADIQKTAQYTVITTAADITKSATYLVRFSTDVTKTADYDVEFSSNYRLDQSNSNEDGNYTWGYLNVKKLAQRFVPTVSKPISKFVFKIRNNFEAADTVIAKLYTEADGKPATVLATSTNNFDGTTHPWENGYYSFGWLLDYPLASGTPYWLGVERTGDVNDGETYALRYKFNNAVGSRTAYLNASDIWGDAGEDNDFVYFEFYVDDITKSAEYRVSTVVDVTKTADYDVLASVDITKSSAYTVPTNTDITKSAEYVVNAGTDVDITKSASYAVETILNVTKSADYDVASSVDVTKSAQYTVISALDITKVAQYTVPSDYDLTKTADYDVARDTDITKSADYDVLINTDVTKSAAYSVAFSTDITKSAKYEVPSDTTITKNAQYTVPFDREANLSAQYTVFDPNELTVSAIYTVSTVQDVPLTSIYTVLTTSTQSLNAAYAVATSLDILKSAAYVVIFDTSVNIPSQYAVSVNLDITKPADYDVLSSADITKSAQYSVPSDVTINMNATYLVATDLDVTKSASYVVESNANIQKSGDYAVATSTDVTKSAEYVVVSSQDITKSAEYLVPTERSTNATAEYEVATSIDVQIPAQYMVAATVDVTKSASYAVATSVDVTKSAQYLVLSVSGDIQKFAQYTVPSDAETSVPAKYEVPSTVDVTKPAEYQVPSNTSIQVNASYVVSFSTDVGKTAQYVVPHDYDITLNANYEVTSAGDVLKSAQYTVPHDYDLTLSADYDVAVATDIQKTASYVVTFDTTIQKTAEYVVLSSADISKVAQYTVPTDTTVQLSAQYAVPSSTDISKSASYTVPTTGDISKSASYIIEFSTTVEKTAQYTVPSDVTVQLTAEYVITSAGDVLKTAQYTVPSEGSVDVPSVYAVQTTSDIGKSAQYVVALQLTGDIQKPATYTVPSVYDYTRPADYDVASNQTVQQSAQYVVVSDDELQKVAQYTVTVEIDLTKGAQYHVATVTNITVTSDYDVALSTDILKSASYVVESEKTVSKSAEYEVDVEATGTISLPAEYALIASADITKVSEYSVTFDTTVALSAKYRVLSIIETPDKVTVMIFTVQAPLEISSQNKRLDIQAARPITPDMTGAKMLEIRVSRKWRDIGIQ